ncbi:MAG: hypothetical protein ACXIT4_07950 [Erythrobacter sp.]
MPDEPRIVKYGLPAAADIERFEAAQTAIAVERLALSELRFQHALRVGPSVRAALDALQCKHAAPQAAQGSPARVVTPEPADLRTALGLR